MTRSGLGDAVGDVWVRTTARGPGAPASVTDVVWFHERLPGYAATPLLSLPDVAELVGARRVWMKHEHERFGLPSFKVLGASWAVYRSIEQRLGRELRDEWVVVDELAALAREAGVTRLVAATDGNHGRAMARVAGWLSLEADILVPAGTAAARIDAICGEGADVLVVEGDYDHAVRAAAERADDESWVISDTSWDGYTEVPTWVSQGYQTLFSETEAELAKRGAPLPTVVLVPVGVGALAVAAVQGLSADDVAFIAVEPVGADCLTQSLRAGQLVTTPGPHHSAMVGLNCGTPSVLAWPLLRDSFSGAVVIDDKASFEAMRLLARRGISVGETGAASLGALMALASTPTALSPLIEEADVLLLCTEAATDPRSYARIVGAEPVD